MSLMRLFTGVPIPAQITEALQQTVARLRPLADLNWTRPEAWHITLKFIGQWQEERLTDLQTALAGIQHPAVLSAHVTGFGYFPNPRRPHTFFAGVEFDPILAALSRRLDAELEPLGCPTESRAYTPHVTLAKIRGQDVTELREEVSRMALTDFGTFQSSQFCLYESRGGVYSIPQTYSFLKEARD